MTERVHLFHNMPQGMCHSVHLCGVCDLDMRHMHPDYVAYAVGICGLCISGGPKHISGWYVLFYVHYVRNVLGYEVLICVLCGAGMRVMRQSECTGQQSLTTIFPHPLSLELENIHSNSFRFLQTCVHLRPKNTLDIQLYHKNTMRKRENKPLLKSVVPFDSHWPTHMHLGRMIGALHGGYHHANSDFKFIKEQCNSWRSSEIQVWRTACSTQPCSGYTSKQNLGVSKQHYRCPHGPKRKGAPSNGDQGEQHGTMTHATLATMFFWWRIQDGS